uniref:Uncharacterized protein n=1 Tax=Acrobeloides nanus TaxID=290746 RepID=A0A914EGY5_9BILA
MYINFLATQFQQLTGVNADLGRCITDDTITSVYNTGVCVGNLTAGTRGCCAYPTAEVNSFTYSALLLIPAEMEKIA